MCQLANVVAILTICYQPDLSKSGYRSTWEQLLSVHITRVSRPDSDGTSTTERATIRGLTTITEAQTISSFPSSTLLQHPNRTDQRSRAHGRPQPREAHPPVQLASSGTHGPRGGFKQGNRARSVTPAPSQEPSTSHTLPQMGERTSSANFTTSTFSFRVPNQTSYPVHRASHNDHDVRPMSTGYSSNSHGFARSIPPPTQAPAPVNVAPPRPSA